MDYIRKRNGELFASDNPEDYFQCPKCSSQTVARPVGVCCDVCGPIEDLILASKENFDSFTPKAKTKAAPKAAAVHASAKG